MYKVLPQMHRLVEQACAVCGLQIAGVVIKCENVGAPAFHIPYYIVQLKPNPRGWEYLSCRPHKGRRSDHSASINNVTVVALRKRPSLSRSCLQKAKDYLDIKSPSRFFSGEDFRREVLPSWRGKLIAAANLDKYKYQISMGFMLLEAGPDYTEQRLIYKYEQRAN